MLLGGIMFWLKVDTQTFTFTSQEDYPAISGVLEYADFSDGKPINAEVSAQKFMGSVRFTLRVPGESFNRSTF